MNNINQTTVAENSFGPKWKGPRNLPKKTGKKFRRFRQTQARKRNRGAYTGR